MYRPPSGARPCERAAPKLTAGDWPRVLTYFMRPRVRRSTRWARSSRPFPCRPP
jgi:hypothetical protein